MGKIELKLQIDADLVERLETAGLDLAEAAEAGIRLAAARGVPPLARDPHGSTPTEEGAERRAREWADANREAIKAFNRRVAERGLLSDYEPFKPRWMR